MLGAPGRWAAPEGGTDCCGVRGLAFSHVRIAAAHPPTKSTCVSTQARFCTWTGSLNCLGIHPAACASLFASATEIPPAVDAVTKPVAINVADLVMAATVYSVRWCKSKGIPDAEGGAMPDPRRLRAGRRVQVQAPAGRSSIARKRDTAVASASIDQ